MSTRSARDRAIMASMKRLAASACLALAGLLGPLPAQARHLSLHDAIVKVEHDTHGKVLSAETRHHGKRTIYRIKVLTPDGRVRVIEVPADSKDAG